MENLTLREIEILIESIEAWKRRDMAADLMCGLMTSMLARDNEELQEKFRLEEEKKKIERERTKENEEIEATLLKAKLMQEKQKRFATIVR